MDTGGVVTDLGQVEAGGNRLGLGCVGGEAVAERGALKEHSELYFCREEWGTKKDERVLFDFYDVYVVNVLQDAAWCWSKRR